MVSPVVCLWLRAKDPEPKPKWVRADRGKFPKVITREWRLCFIAAKSREEILDVIARISLRFGANKNYVQDWLHKRGFLREGRLVTTINPRPNAALERCACGTSIPCPNKDRFKNRKVPRAAKITFTMRGWMALVEMSPKERAAEIHRLVKKNNVTRTSIYSWLKRNVPDWSRRIKMGKDYYSGRRMG